MTVAYDIGDQKRISMLFTNLSGVPADPDTVTFKLSEPDGVDIDYTFGTDSELVKDSTGNYHVDILFSKAGRHIARFNGTGTVFGSEDTDIYIKRAE